MTRYAFPSRKPELRLTASPSAFDIAVEDACEAHARLKWAPAESYDVLEGARDDALDRLLRAFEDKTGRRL